MADFLLAPAARLDFAEDWRAKTNGDPNATDWLAVGETITAFTVTATTGVTVASSSESNGKITAWLTGGVLGQTPAVSFHITTSAGRQDTRTFYVEIVNR